jgi:peptide/nickel transport system permease protein
MTALDPTVRVGALLAEAVRRHQGLPRAAARAAALELLETVNLPNPEEVARRYPHQISGGMAQRVAIALALAGRPELIVADEPTSALDVTVQAEIIALLRRLQAEMGLSLILITHHWGVVAQLCKRALVMYAGEIVEAGSVRRLYHDAAHPYTAGLLAANPQRALALAATNGQLTQLPAIPGSVPAPRDWPAGCHFQDRCSYVTAECRAELVPLVEVDDRHVSRCIHIGELRRPRAAS